MVSTLLAVNHQGQVLTSYNYKQSFSIVLMAIVNANYEFMVDVGANGRVSDEGVFSNTKFYELLVENILNIPQPDKLPNSEIKQL